MELELGKVPEITGLELNGTGKKVSVPFQLWNGIGHHIWMLPNLNTHIVRTYIQIQTKKSIYLFQVSALLLIPAMVLLVQTLVNNLMQIFGSELAEQESQGTVIVLQPVLPGVNMPLGELGYYFIPLLICSIIHEAGHAIAAVEADVRVLGFGIMVFFVLPAAHVDLPTDQLLALRKSRQLRVFAAGIWHNIVLAVVAYLVLFSAPSLFSPFFRHGTGVAVASVAAGAAVEGPTGLKVGDAVVAINDCPVRNKVEWRNCLILSITQPITNVCMKKKLVADLDESVIINVKKTSSPATAVVECCDTSKASSHLCFVDDFSKGGNWKGHACLPVRNVLERSRGRCNMTELCIGDSFCMKPALGNSSRLLQVIFLNPIQVVLYPNILTFYGYAYS